MICHTHKCIFIHIPKTGGMSIYNFFFPKVIFYQNVPNYDILFGWCPKRRIHLQHATSRQLLESELISKEQWDSYFKFTFIRNPWDRAYSDYKWLQEFTGERGNFKEYIMGEGKFEKYLKHNLNSEYLGDHLLNQCEFFDREGNYEMDFVGRFENFSTDIHIVLEKLGIKEKFGEHLNRSRRIRDYSHFYTKSKKKLVDKKFELDIKTLGYEFVDNKSGFKALKKYF